MSPEELQYAQADLMQRQQELIQYRDARAQELAEEEARLTNELLDDLNAVLKEARSRGVTIIHSPSDCMPAYEKPPARINAKLTIPAEWVPHDVRSWCSLIPTEERAAYPIDQSDGGEDDDPEEHAKWVTHLKSLGRNPGTPWKKQSDLIEINGETDFISDRGDEVWNVLESRLRNPHE